MMNPTIPPMVGQLIDMALEEDLGRGDVTTRLCVPQDHNSIAEVVAKSPLVVSGLDVFVEVFHRVDASISFTPLVTAGQQVAAGEVMARAEGETASLLMGERVALNFLQRLCGIATATRAYVGLLPSGSRTRLVDTRKTTPGMRYLERRAVLDGGGGNHRVDLGGGILIKENHIRAAGSVSAAVTRCVEQGPHPLLVEVEVTCQAELEEAINAGAQVVMLDNMTAEELTACVSLAAGRVKLEASGGINHETVAQVARTGVDIISVGAFTHSAKASDISLLIKEN